ncbi:MAG: DNA repair protein RecO [bacterium]|nr:DNA repair protein RecO [bacterium]
MSDLRRDQAIVLRVIPFSETSQILTVFARQHGKLGLMAKGARRKVKNGTALAIEPGYEIEIVWSHKQSRDLQLVREMSLLNSHFDFRASLESLVCAQATIELILRCLTDDDPHPELFDAARQTFTQYESRSTPRLPILWKFELVLLAQLGFAPTDKELATLKQAVLNPESVAVLRKLNSSSFDVAARLRTSPSAEREITRWLATYFAEHMAFPLNSRAQDALRWARLPSI